MKKNINLVFIVVLFVYTTMNNHSNAEQITKKVTNEYTYHGEKYIDSYSWLRDKDHPIVDDPNIVSFISRENNKTNNYFKENNTLVNQIYSEIKDRTPEKINIPYEDMSFTYNSDYSENAKYLTHYITDKNTGLVRVLLDENQRAENKSFYKLVFSKVSPNGRFYAWIEDDNGHEEGKLYIKDLITNKIVSTHEENVGNKLVWDKDSLAIYFIKKDQKGRDYQIEQKAIIGSTKNKVVYKEEDEYFQVWLEQSINDNKIFISAYNWNTKETRLITNVKGDIEVEILVSRKLNSLHYIDYINGQYYLYTNFFNKDFDLFSANDNIKSPSKWKKIIQKGKNTFIKKVVFFEKFFAIPLRENGLDDLLIIDTKNGKKHHVKFDDKIVGITFNGIKQNPYGDVVRLRVESNLTPRAIYDYNIKKRTFKMVSQATVKGYDKEKYAQERLLIPSVDGTRIPATVIYNKSFGPSIDNPVYMYVYGAYGDGIPPEFPVFALSAIDRGFTYVIAHVRGGDELGKNWHEQGKLFNRKNSFDDFISISQYLVDKGYVAKGNISASGESAAGTIIGVAINERPDLYKSVSILVPFVDVLNSLMDSSLEYTMTDWSEYGNPKEDKKVFDYIRSYSPYEQIKKQKYPNIYVTGGINDAAVGYWEPAKWVSKIRDNQTNKSLILTSFRKGGHIDNGYRTVELEFAKQIAFLITTNNSELQE